MRAAEMVTVHVRVNGEAREALVEPRTAAGGIFCGKNLNLTGTHIGCDTTYCGACTVLLNGRTVKACTLFAPMADGSEITDSGGACARWCASHPCRHACAECHGCNAGSALRVCFFPRVYLLSNNSKPTDQQIRKAIAGNTCRCTGYQKHFEGGCAWLRANGEALAMEIKFNGDFTVKKTQQEVYDCLVDPKRFATAAGLSEHGDRGRQEFFGEA